MTSSPCLNRANPAGRLLRKLVSTTLLSASFIQSSISPLQKAKEAALPSSHPLQYIMLSASSALGRLILLLIDATKSSQETFTVIISASTVRRGLKKCGLKAVVKTKGPVLSQCYHRERLDFAKSHEHWTLEDWKRVIWSDGRKWVWKKKRALVTGWCREHSNMEVDM